MDKENTGSRWYMTTSMPFDMQYAVKAHNITDATEMILGADPVYYHHAYSDYGTWPELPDISLLPDISFRPCPPDLCEWLDAAMHIPQHFQGMPDCRCKVPGGWMYRNENFKHTFVPVAGAAGITVINPS